MKGELMFLGYFKEVQFRGVSRRIESCFKKNLGVFQECHMEIRKMFKSFNDFLRKYQGCFKDVLKTISQVMHGCLKKTLRIF